MNKTISYDKGNDILAIHKGFSSDEKFKGNIDAGDLILDVSTKGRIRGIEIMNAIEFFKEFNIGKRILTHINDAQFTSTIKPNSVMLGIIIKSENAEIPAKIAVPLEMPVSY